MKTQGTRGSAFDGFIRATEQDDFLLYVTAAVGVLMPGCVYLFYRYAHKLYCQYAQRCEWHRKVDELERSAITIFYAEGSGHAEGLARQIGALLDYERPPIVNLADIDTATFVKYKGIGLFLVESAAGGHEPQCVEWFFDFLEHLAFDRKSSSLPCRQMHFAVLGIGNPRVTQGSYNRAAEALTRRLTAIGAVAICPAHCICSHTRSELEKQGHEWVARIVQALDGFTAKMNKRPQSFWCYSDSRSSSSTTDDDNDEYSPDHLGGVYDSENGGVDEHLDEPVLMENDVSSLCSTDGFGRRRHKISPS